MATVASFSIIEILKEKIPIEDKISKVAEVIRFCGSYRWVGIYEVTSSEIKAVAWTGNSSPEFPTFPRSSGLNGEAVRLKQIINVGDVAKDSRYLTAFGSTRSEIIVPVIDNEDRVVATIDVESERVNAFTEKDEQLLREYAGLLCKLWI